MWSSRAASMPMPESAISIRSQFEPSSAAVSTVRIEMRPPGAA